MTISPTTAGARRGHAVVLQLHLVLANLRLHGGQLRLGVLVRRLGLLELGAADRAGVEQLLHARELLLGEREVGFAREPLRLGRRDVACCLSGSIWMRGCPAPTRSPAHDEDLPDDALDLRLHRRRPQRTDRRRRTPTTAAAVEPRGSIVFTSTGGNAGGPPPRSGPAPPPSMRRRQSKREVLQREQSELHRDSDDVTGERRGCTGRS